MKKSALAIMVVASLGLAACSSTKQTAGVDPGQVQNLKDERLSTDFEREGIRVFYTMFGKVDRIEAYGYAEVWRRDFNIVAEADAKDKLIKFLRGETVSTQRMTKVIAKSIERSQDNSRNRFRTVDGTTNTSAEEIEREETQSQSKDENGQVNTALRKNSVNSAQQVTSTITVTAKGRLSAVRKHSGGVVDDGKTYRAVYVWSAKDDDAARTIRNLMDAK